MEYDKDRTLFVGSLDSRVTEELLYELFLQIGPLENVILALDKDGRTRRFAFIIFKHAASVPYSINVLKGTLLFRSYLKLSPYRGLSSHNKEPDTFHGEPSREREQTSSSSTKSQLAKDSWMLSKTKVRVRRTPKYLKYIGLRHEPIKNPYAYDDGIGTLRSCRESILATLVKEKSIMGLDWS